MELSFRQFVEQNVPGTHNDGPGGAFNIGTGGSFITSDQSGSETFDNRSPYFPSYELTAQVAPHTTIYGTITQIKEHQPPHKTMVQIRINLSSDSVSYKPNGKSETILINTDQYRTIQKMNGGRKPRAGNKTMVKLLRLPEDHTSEANVMGMLY